MLQPFLRTTGYQNIQAQAHFLEYSAGTEAHEPATLPVRVHPQKGLARVKRYGKLRHVKRGEGISQHEPLRCLSKQERGRRDS